MILSTRRQAEFFQDDVLERHPLFQEARYGRF